MQPQFDPFGEPVPATDHGRASVSPSRWLTRAGAAVFWIAAIGIVAARAIWFDPDWAARFDQAIALVRNFSTPFG